MYGQKELSVVYLKDKKMRESWLSLLQQSGIERVSEAEILSLDRTFGLYQDDHLVATVSYSKNIIKYVAILENYREGGRVFNQLISKVMSTLAYEQIFHILVFTKPVYIQSFNYLGFQLLTQTPQGAFLETGDDSIQRYLAQLPKAQKNAEVAAIVMNANPFTKGHLYLIEEALKQSDFLYIFVVSAEESLFTSKERYELVRAGVDHLKNVAVCPGGEYMVSLATFPAYFLQSEDEVIAYQTELDARLFKEWIVPYCHITKRFLGSEPCSHTTDLYNQMLCKILPPEVTVKIIKRKETKEKEVISASKVRQFIAQDQIYELLEWLPQSTYDFIVSNIKKLRIKASRKDEEHED